MGFFEIPPAPEVEDEDLADDHMPDIAAHWLGGVVPIELIIGRSDDAAIGVRRIVAFEDGFELELVAWVRNPIRPRRHYRFRSEVLLVPHGPFDMRDDDGHLIDELVRFGVQFPDGAKVTNLQDGWMLSPEATEPIHGMESRGGSGTDGQASQEFWIWPIPAIGELTLVCEWPAYGITESQVTIDGEALRDASARSSPVWPDEPAAGDSHSGNRRRRHGHYSAAVGHMIRHNHDQSNGVDDHVPDGADPAGE